MTPRGLTEDERALLASTSRWGSGGYPIHRYRAGKWGWGPWRSVQGPPILFKTRCEAVASFEQFLDVLRDAHAGRI